MRDTHYPSIPIEDALYEAEFIHIDDKPTAPTESVLAEWSTLQRLVYAQEMNARGQTYGL